jgi:acyl-coenzyme A synthetase/AMP-(fatty) acid ligase
VLYRDRVLTYRQLALRSNRLANALRAGLKRGDRVAIVSPNRPDIVDANARLQAPWRRR